MTQLGISERVDEDLDLESLWDQDLVCDIPNCERKAKFRVIWKFCCRRWTLKYCATCLAAYYRRFSIKRGFFYEGFCRLCHSNVSAESIRPLT